MIEWLTRGLVVTQLLFLIAKVFGWITASWWVVFIPGFIFLGFVALALFMVSVVYND